MKLVSSPHRYCRNVNTIQSGIDAAKVSSPHRYCRNWRSGSPGLIQRATFQALIGTVETYPTAPFSRSGDAFQALIGTVETRQCDIDDAVSPPFQALIGTVETAGQTLRGFVQTCFKPS